MTRPAPSVSYRGGVVISRAIYHGIAAATAYARVDGFGQVTGAHLIVAFLQDRGSVVAQAAGDEEPQPTLHQLLITEGEPRIDARGSAPVPLAPDVYDAVMSAERATPVPTTGHVLLRLLADGDSDTSARLTCLGMDPRALAARTARLLCTGTTDLG